MADEAKKMEVDKPAEAKPAAAPAEKKEEPKKKDEKKKPEKKEEKEEKKEAKKEEPKKEEPKKEEKKDAKKDAKKEEPKKEEKKEERKPEKKEAKKEEVEEDEESSSGEELPPGLLERNPRVEGKRERKSTDRLTLAAEVRERPKVVIPEGKGTPLGEIEHVKSQLTKFHPMQLKEIHAVLFNTPGGKHTLKMDIRKFKGFAFAEDAEKAKKLEYIEKKKVDSLRFMCDFFNLPRQNDKGAMAKAILEFLESPHPKADDGAAKPKAGAAKKKVTKKKVTKKKSAAKPAKKAVAAKPVKAKKEKKEGPKKPKNAYMFFNEEKRGGIMAENPQIKIADLGKKVGELWRELTDEQKVKYNELAAGDKARYEKEAKAFVPSKPPKEKESGAKKRKADDDDKPLKAKRPKKDVPTDAEIQAVMKAVAKKVGENVTFKNMKEALLTKYPGLNIDARRDEYKAMAQSIVASQPSDS